MSNPYDVWNAPRPERNRFRNLLPSQIEAIAGPSQAPAMQYMDITGTISQSRFTEEARKAAAIRNFNIYALHPDIPAGEQPYNQLRRDIAQTAPRFGIHAKFPSQYYTVTQGNTRMKPNTDHWLD